MHDLRYAIRTLARTPAFTAIAVATLALGIGTTTAIYSLFDAVLLRPLAVDRPHELRVVKQLVSFGKISKETTYVSHAWFTELRSQPEVFSAVTAFAEGRDAIVTVNGRQSRLIGGAVFVADNYFELLGVRAAAGRLFTADAPGVVDRSIVISEAMRLRLQGPIKKRQADVHSVVDVGVIVVEFLIRVFDACSREALRQDARAIVDVILVAPAAVDVDAAHRLQVVPVLPDEIDWVVLAPFTPAPLDQLA